MSTTNERKARRIKRIRQEIMKAATDVIRTDGYKHTTTKKIAQKADMAEGTLYNYFNNKNELLISIAERYLHYKRDFNASTDVNSLQELMVNFFSPKQPKKPESLLHDREMLRALLPELLTDKDLGPLYYERIVRPYLETIEEKLSELKNNGLVANYDVKALSRILYGAFIGFAILDINGDPEVTNPTPDFQKEVSRAFVEVLSKGMSK